MRPNANQLIATKARLATFTGIVVVMLTSCASKNETPQSIAKKADAYARAVAPGDLAKQLRAFDEAFRQGMKTGKVPLPEDKNAMPGLHADSIVPPSRAWADQEFVRNRDRNRTDVLADRAAILIVGGQDDCDFTEPFHDCVTVRQSPERGTAVVLTKRAILTAAHCVPFPDHPETVRVRLGCGDNGPVYKAWHVTHHPDFASSKCPDLAVVHLTTDLPSHVEVRPRATTDMLKDIHTVLAVGYGAPAKDGTGGFGVRRRVPLTICSTACEPTEARPNLPADFGCNRGCEMVSDGGEGDTCVGDSGGPTYVLGPGSTTAKPVYWLGGITVEGRLDATTLCGDGGRYVRIDKYESWISTEAARVRP